MSLDILSIDYLVEIMKYSDQYTLMSLRILSRDLMKAYDITCAQVNKGLPYKRLVDIPQGHIAFISTEMCSTFSRDNYTLFAKLELTDISGGFLMFSKNVSKRFGYILKSLEDGRYNIVTSGYMMPLNVPHYVSFHKPEHQTYYGGTYIYSLCIPRKTISDSYSRPLYSYEEIL